MLGQITIQLAELHRAELLADAVSHRTARARTSSTITSRLLAVVPFRRAASNDVDLDVAAACCTAA